LYKNIPVSSAIIKGSVFARNRAPGDKIRIGNMSRLLKKVFSESGLSTVERSFLPVIYCEKGIVAVPLFKVSSDFAKPEKNENNASIAFYKKL
jgi:tRNA(Ile)-lysidine synthetase-like protein